MEQSFPALLFLPNLGSWKCFSVVAVLWRGGSSVRVCTTLYKQKDRKSDSSLKEQKYKGRQKTADG